VQSAVIDRRYKSTICGDTAFADPSTDASGVKETGESRAFWRGIPEMTKIKLCR
jgi:hypothetical protein